MAKQGLDKSVDEKQWDPDSIHYRGRQKSDAVANNSKKVFNLEKLISSDATKEKISRIKQIKESFRLGQEYFKEGNFKEAEKELVKVTKPVLSKSSMKDLYVRVEDVKEESLDSIYHLGLIYLNDASYFNHHAKATGIFQYCAAFAKKYRTGDAEFYLKHAHKVEMEFLKSIDVPTSEHTKSKERLELYKEELEDFREEVKARLMSIKELTIDQIGIRANLIEGIYNDCSNFFVKHSQDRSNQLTKSGGLVQRLLADCYKQLGNPPEGSEHSIIALGSLALGTMTPWSDLEFAILVNEDVPAFKEYFRNLAKLLHIKIINLGETPLRSIGIDSLNDFKTGDAQDEWFWDDIIKIKFNLDGPRWDACKLPLGRQGDHIVIKTVKNKETELDEEITITKPNYELILTPDEMAAFQRESIEKVSNKEHRSKILSREDEGTTALEIGAEKETSVTTAAVTSTTSAKNWFESDKHLVQALRSVALIEGSQELLDEYRSKAQQAENPEILQARALQILEEDLNKFSLKLGDEEEGSLIDSKMHIYRLGDRVINGLSNYYNVTAELGSPKLTVWQMIDKMYQAEILSLMGAQHLKEAIAIATELRLNAYSHNDNRSEAISTYVPAVEHLTEEERHRLIEATFYTDKNGIKSLYHFYYVMLRVQTIIEAFCDRGSHNHAKIFLKYDNIFDASNYGKGMVHARFLEYDQALIYMEKAEEEQPENLELLQNLFSLYHRTSTIDRAITIAHRALELKKDGTDYPDIAASYHNLGIAYSDKGDYDQAQKYYDQALEVMHKFYNSTPNHPDIAMAYNNLGIAYHSRGKHDKAIEYHNQALGIMLKAYKSSPNHPNISASYRNLGNAYQGRGEYDQAIRCHQQALKITLKIYENNPNRPDISACYNNLGNAYNSKGEHDKAIKNYQEALNIRLKYYKSSPDHPDIAASYHNLGEVCRGKGEYDQAIGYYNQALGIMLKAYESSPNHLDVATVYNNLGNAHGGKKQYDQAIDYYNRALGIMLKAYESGLNHPDIAMVYNNLGNCHRGKGEHDKAIDYYNQALVKMLKDYKNNFNHPNISSIYNNLGNVYHNKGEYDQAIKYYNQSLEIRLKAYESSPNHPDIAVSYYNLGNAYNGKGEYDKVFLYAEKALNILYQHQNYHQINITKDLYDRSLIQLGNLSLLASNEEKAKEHYGKINPQYEQIDFCSEDFVKLQLHYSNLAYESNDLLSAINCQKVLVKVDPKLKCGNHYHNLACFYFAQNNIDSASAAFLEALMHPNIGGGLNTEYAQFLIANKNLAGLAVNLQEISEHLYKTINSENAESLCYGKMEQRSVCNVLSILIKQKDNKIEIDSKALAYYLLIKNPEYIKEHDRVEALLQSFTNYCEDLQHEIPFRLLSDIYGSFNNRELLDQYLAKAELIMQVEDILSTKQILDKNLEQDNSKILALETTKKYVNDLKHAGQHALANYKFDDSIKIYHRIFQIYKFTIIDEPKQLQSAKNNLATVALIINNIDLYVALKTSGVDLNINLIQLAGQDVATVLQKEDYIQIALQMRVPTVNYTNENAESKNSSENDDILHTGEIVKEDGPDLA